MGFRVQGLLRGLPQIQPMHLLHVRRVLHPLRTANNLDKVGRCRELGLLDSGGGGWGIGSVPQVFSAGSAGGGTRTSDSGVHQGTA